VERIRESGPLGRGSRRQQRGPRGLQRNNGIALSDQYHLDQKGRARETGEDGWWGGARETVVPLKVQGENLATAARKWGGHGWSRGGTGEGGPYAARGGRYGKRTHRLLPGQGKARAGDTVASGSLWGGQKVAKVGNRGRARIRVKRRRGKFRLHIAGRSGSPAGRVPRGGRTTIQTQNREA